MWNLKTCKMAKNFLVYVRLSIVKIRSTWKQGQTKRNVSKNTATLLRNSSFSCLMSKTKYSYWGENIGVYMPKNLDGIKTQRK